MANAKQVQANFEALKNAVTVLEVGGDTQGRYNTALGRGVLASNTTGGNNIAGVNALFRNTTGSDNTAVGVDALQSNTTGDYNTAVGVSALYSNTTGGDNLAVGSYALQSNTRGNYNIAVGNTALFSNTTGNANTASGNGALEFNIDGSANTAIGVGAGSALTSGANNIYLGNAGATTESNTLRLGQDQTRTFLAGIRGVPVSGSAVFINSQGQLGIQPSSARYKRDIEPLGTRSRGLFQLRPVTFRYQHDEQGERQYGLITEEVAKVYPELVTRDAAGQIESVRYQEVIPLLLNELQHQQRQLAAQSQQLAELRAKNARLQATMGQRQERDAAFAARLERLEAAATRAAALTSP